MRMVGMEHFGTPVNNPVFRGISEVRSWNGRRRIAECIGAVSQGFIFKTKVFVLHMHQVDSEWLAPII